MPPAADPAPKPKPSGAARPAARKFIRPPNAGPVSRPGARDRTVDAGPRQPAKPKRDWREELSDEERAKMVVRPRNDGFVPDKAMDPDDLIGGARRFIFDLSTADKLAFFGAATMFFSSFFPWKETVREGDILGLMSLGVVVFVLSLGAMVVIAARVSNAFPKTNPLIPWIAQLAAVSGSALWCLLYMRLSWDSTIARSPIGNYEMWVSKPTFGVILAFFAAVVACLGTFLGLKDTGR